MVLFLSIIIFFMIIDRYIYKSKTFKEARRPPEEEESVEQQKLRD